MNEELRFRFARDTDVPELAALYSDSIRRLGPEYYGPAAVEAWAAFSQSHRFREFILDNQTLVAEGESRIVAFGGIDDSGRIASLYVHPNQSRQGIGSALLRALLKMGKVKGLIEFHTEASEFSKPLFERFGFSLVGGEVVERAGVSVERYRMKKLVTGQSEPNRRARLMT